MKRGLEVHLVKRHKVDAEIVAKLPNAELVKVHEQLEQLGVLQHSTQQRTEQYAHIFGKS